MSLRLVGIGVIGLIGGFASGLFGVGGGLLFVPLLVLFLGVNIHVAIGTSLAAIVPTALVGAARHFFHHSVDFKMALALALFAMIGAWVGSGVSIRLDVVMLRKIFAGFLFVLALRMFFKQ